MKNIEWKTLEWNKYNNTELAKKIKRSTQRVAVKRSEFAPGSLRKDKVNWNKKSMWKKYSTKELSKQLGYSEGYVQTQRKKNAPDTIGLYNKKSADWENLNWDTPNQKLSEEIGCTYMTVWNNRTKYANNSKKPRSLWKAKVESVIAGDKSHIVAETFIEQSAVRNAARLSGHKLVSKIRKDGKWNLYAVKG